MDSLPTTTTTFPDSAWATSTTSQHLLQGQRDDLFQTIQRGMEHPATGRGILIGMVSASGFVVMIGLTIAILYFLRCTQKGRIMLDRMSRPGQFDDEQAMLREEAEALETMDDMHRAEYMRAKGELYSHPTDNAEFFQLLYRRILQNLFRQTYRYPSFWRYKRKGYQPGNLNQNSRLQIVSCKRGRKSSSLTLNAVFRATFQFQNRTKFIIGKQRYMINQKQRF